MANAPTMRIGIFFNPTGHHVASWRHPDAQADAGINFEHYVAMTQAAERAKVDYVFLADQVGIRDASMEALSRSAQYIANFEPLTLLSGLAAVTKQIGLVATASTSYNHPYHVARKFASLDLISHGRAGWNIVTSSFTNEARNFGREEHFEHGERYERAKEFAEIVLGLWDSWDDDAFVRDKGSGLFFDPAKLHALGHTGEFFSVQGPLNAPRPPQGYPVLVQAGASEDGRDLAAHFAEIIFSNHFELEAAQAFRADVKARAAALGRNPNHVLIMPGLSPIVGRTSEEAEERYTYLQSLIDPVVAREILSTVLGGPDLSGYPLDGQLPDDIKPRASHKGNASFENWVNLARREKLTIRELSYRAAGARGKAVVRGSPSEIADHMEAWFKNGGADGFNIMPPYLPGALNDFLGLVVPELQRRGIFQTEYTGSTLREHLGLPRPASRYTHAGAAAAPIPY